MPEATAARIAGIVRERYPSELNERHDEISYIIDTGRQHVQRIGANQAKGLRLRPAITLSDASVRFEFSYTHASRHGNIALPKRLLIFQAIIIGYNAVNGRTVTLPDNEAEGWARAVLGPELCNYAYKVEGPSESPRYRRSFPVLVDRESGPIAAPAEFDWNGIILEKTDPTSRLLTVPLISG